MKRFRIKKKIGPLSLGSFLVSYIIEERHWLFFWYTLESYWGHDMELQTVEDAKKFIVNVKQRDLILNQPKCVEHID